MSNPKPDLKYIYAFSLIPSVGAATFKKLAANFPNFQAAWQADVNTIVKKTNLREDLVQKIVSTRAEIEVEVEWEKFSKTNLHLITLNDETYPSQLKEIKTCPFLLFCLGDNLELLGKKQLAVVGSRKSTKYGQLATEKIVGDLANTGLVITSGLAFGIDQVAHGTALENGIETIAVLGSGIEEALNRPAVNQIIQKIIQQNGLVISEYPPNFSSSRFTFPARNRIISGLSLGVLVAEAAEKSGALITARYALEQNRDVLAIPNSIFAPQSAGALKLIKQGAQIVTSANDILENFNFSSLNEKTGSPQAINFADKEEEKIYKALSLDPLTIDKISKNTGLSPQTVSAKISLLELGGLVSNIGGGKFIRK